MKNLRRPIVALSTAVALVAVQMVLDPTGLIALVGWSGATPEFDRGLWPFAPYLVFLPVLLAVVWWVALRAGNRFWTLFVGNVLAVLLAQAATLLAMTGDLANSGWGAGYVTAKAIPAALIIAALTRWFGGFVTVDRHLPGAVVAPSILFAAAAPLVAGQWWTAVVFAPGVPVARPERGWVSVLIATVLLAAIAVPCVRWMRSRVRGVLGGWLGALVAGGILGVVQGVTAVVIDGMPSSDLWPGMAIYVGLADGLAYGAALGWVAGIGGVVADRAAGRLAARKGANGRESRTIVAATAAASILLIVAAMVTAPGPVTRASGNEAVPAGFLRNDNGVISDGRGNQVLLRGVNVNQLVDFYAPRPEVPVTTPLTDQDFAGIASYGFNVVRLGLSWSALEPKRGEFDQKYLAQISAAVERAKDEGLYVVLDMHQDSWWNEGTPPDWTCRPGTTSMWGYDGAPRWATITDSAPRCQFQSRDISPASDRAFQNFYFDTEDVQAAFIEAWGVLASAYGADPTVAGFDLLNEPGFGETAPATTSLLLGRFYDRAIAAIRAEGAPQIVFIEPSILWSGMGFDTGPASRFTATPISSSRRISMRSPSRSTHRWALRPSWGWSGNLGSANAPQAITTPHSGRASTGFGAIRKTASPSLRATPRSRIKYRIGGAYWVWKQACGDPQNGVQDIGDGLVIQDCASGNFSGTNDGLLDILSRSYPQSAPGTVTSLDSHGSKMVLAGSAGEHSCGLKVWVPGDAKPSPSVPASRI